MGCRGAEGGRQEGGQAAGRRGAGGKQEGDGPSTQPENRKLVPVDNRGRMMWACGMHIAVVLMYKYRSKKACYDCYY